MFDEQDGEDSYTLMKVNVFDVLAVLFRTVMGLFGVFAGAFQGLAMLAQAHSNYYDDKREFHAAVTHDIEMLGGE